jgi:hypothetical protein
VAKESKRRCISEYQGDFTGFRSTYQEHHGFAYDDYPIGIEEEIKTDHKIFFRYVDLKKGRVGYPSVMNFKGQSGSGSQEICDLLRG